MIGIIGAMDVEVQSLTNIIEDISVSKISGVTFYSGNIDGKEVVVAKCGIGKILASICAQTMILNYPLECIINLGVAGSLSAKLKIADIVIGEYLVQHDMDTSPIGDPLGLVSGFDIIQIPCDTKLVNKIRESADKIAVDSLVGVIATGDQFVCDSNRKQFIIEEFGAIACEMEGASIALVAYVNKVPCAVIRAISDSADGSAQMDYPTFVEKAAARSFQLMKEFIKTY